MSSFTDTVKQSIERLRRLTEHAKELERLHPGKNIENLAEGISGRSDEYIGALIGGLLLALITWLSLPTLGALLGLSFFTKLGVSLVAPFLGAAIGTAIIRYSSRSEREKRRFLSYYATLKRSWDELPPEIRQNQDVNTIYIKRLEKAPTMYEETYLSEGLDKQYHPSPERLRSLERISPTLFLPNPLEGNQREDNMPPNEDITQSSSK